MAARAFGSATVSFGLVSIPIKVYTTTKSGSGISFHLLHGECGTRLKQQYICPSCDVVVPRTEMTKGYEYAKGQYVKLDKDELAALEAVSSNTIALAEFVPADAVDPVYIDKSYYIGPDKHGERAYALLSRAMRETGLVGLARYSARGKQYVVMMRPHGPEGSDRISMHQLRYAEEVRGFEEVPMGDTPAIADAEMSLAVQIIEQIAAEVFEPEKFTDEVRERVLELINSKLEGEDITVVPEAPKGEIIDLMEALKASLGASADAARKPAKAATKAKAATEAKAAPKRKKASRSSKS